MATVNASAVGRAPMNGEYGNLCARSSSITLAAQASGDVIRFCDLPAGSEVLNVEVPNDAMGGSTTLALGYEYLDVNDGAAQPTAFKAATSTASAGKITTSFHPVQIERPFRLIGTIGGAAMTGKLTAIVHYIYKGTM